MKIQLKNIYIKNGLVGGRYSQKQLSYKFDSTITKTKTKNKYRAMSVKYCRDELRKQVLSFTKGKDLKQDWIISKNVEYNGKEYDNISGTKCDDESGMWRMGYDLFPSEEIDGYKFIHYTVLHGVVKVNAEINFNKKLTCMGGFFNTFLVGMKYMSGKEMCEDYLQPLLQEKSQGLITEENGFTFKSV